MMSTRIVAPLILITCLASTASVTPTLAGDDIKGNVYLGWGNPQGDSGDVADSGWMIGGGVAFYPSHWKIGLTVGLEYSEFDLNDDIVDLYDGTGGEINIWGLPIGAIWSSDSSGRVNFYAAGGTGLYRVEGQIFDIGIVNYPPVCDPWTWWCVPGGPGLGEGVRDEESTTKLGYHASAGLSFGDDRLSGFYIEARWQQIETENSTELLSFLLGVRW